MTLPSLSFEFFPPKTEEMERHLWSAFAGLSPLAPQFVSVTYGAGGQARSRTHEIVTAIQAKSGIQAAAHLTCIGASADEIATIADTYWQAGIKHIVALRGDLSDGAGGSVGAYPYAVDLVRALLARHPFEISVAAYPETHPQALSPEADMDNLKRKIDAGATRAITQFFFDNSFYYRFLERADKAGINVPIVPGMLPISNFARTQVFAARCGSVIPSALAEKFAALDEQDSAGRHQLALDVAMAQCRDLLASGRVNHLHFYTLNRAELVRDICKGLAA
jgi:methylenetetrahydrofolate reductase (NADPH)